MKIMVSACLAGENCKYARSNEESARHACMNEHLTNAATEYEVRGYSGNNRNEKVLQLLMENGFHCVDVEDL